MADKLISADALQKVFNEVSSGLLAKPELSKDAEHIVRACLMVTQMINDAPTIEAEPTLSELAQYCEKRNLVLVERELFNEMKSRWSVEPIKHGVIELTYEEYGELCSYALADEQKHGKWIESWGGKWHSCSVCGGIPPFNFKGEDIITKYCPHCGAKMDEVTK